MAARVEVNRRGVQELLKSPGVAAELHRRAVRVLAAARSSAPVVSGAYKASLEVRDDTHPTRVVAHVAAMVPYGMAVEARTGTLARALDAGGGA